MTAFLVNTGLEESEGKFRSMETLELDFWILWDISEDIGDISEDIGFWVAVIGVVHRGVLCLIFCVCARHPYFFLFRKTIK